MLRVANSNDTTRQLIANEYMIPKFRIHERLVVLEIHTSYHASEIREDAIFLRDSSTIFRFLRTYGEIITRLEARDCYGIEIPLAAIVADKCARTLVDFKIRNFDVFIKVILDKPIHFEMLERLVILADFYIKNGPAKFTFDKLTTLQLLVRETDKWHHQMMQLNSLKDLQATMYLMDVYEVLEQSEHPSSLERLHLTWVPRDIPYTTTLLDKHPNMQIFEAFVRSEYDDCEETLLELVRSKWGEIKVEREGFGSWAELKITRA